MTDKRRRGLLGAIAADPWRKLLAITLAVMSWFFVDNRINRTYSRTVPLVFVGAQTAAGAAVNRLALALRDDVVLGQRFLDGNREITEVKVSVTGPRFRVDDVEKLPLDLQVTAFLGYEWGEESRTGGEFTAQDVRGDQRLLDGLKIEIQPARIRFEVKPLAERPFALSVHNVDVEAGQFDGRLQHDTAEFTPPTAIVRGPADELARLARRTDTLFRATMKAGSNDRQARGEIELVGAPGLRLDSTPLVTMLLRPLTVRVPLEVLIDVDDLALPEGMRGLYQPEERAKTVTVLAGGHLRAQLEALRDSGKSALQQFADENLRLQVMVPRPKQGQPLEPEIVGLKARLVVVGPLAATVASNECLLDELVTVKLKRAP